MNPINYGLAIFWPDFLWETFSRYSMAFIDPLYQNKPNITEFLLEFFFAYSDGSLPSIAVTIVQGI